MRLLKNFIFLTAVTTGLILSSCSDDNNGDGDPNQMTGQVSVKITDAPVDNAEVEGVIVTVTDVKIDGESFAGFEGKQTIDLMAYQNGNTRLLADAELEATNYSEVSLVLDYETDENGESPGCYVKKSDGSKESLSANGESNAEIALNHDFMVESQSQTSLVIDFDLRKTVSETNNEYQFVAESHMESRIRIENESETGHIKGESEDTPSSDETFVVYAYSEGSFDAETETTAGNEGDLLFANAVTSSKVEGDGSYQLSFLEEGDYEITVAKYSVNNSGKTEFQGLFDLFLLIGGSASSTAVVEVSSGSEISVDIDLEGMLSI